MKYFLHGLLFSIPLLNSWCTSDMRRTHQLCRIHSHLPYAHYAWSRLAGFANRKNYKRVFDIASSTFYNRHLFDARWYIGGDISESKLRKGISDYTEDKSIACLTNIADLPMIESLADLIVCTYTLIFIPPSAREVIIQRLILMTAAGGDLFVEMPRSGPAPQIRLLLEQNFQDVCVTYFNSPMSRFYQRTLGRRVKHDHVLVRIMVIGLTFLFERSISEYIIWQSQCISAGKR